MLKKVSGKEVLGVSILDDDSIKSFSDHLTKILKKDEIADSQD
jgi:hypothetical protein